MSQINILDSAIFNRIAAGEVVESPVSVVKELIENSIDAGADTLTVEVKGGGIDYIRVTDNGKGIAAEEIPIAFLPHATSKIRSLDDLEKIGTLGFRGEALPSIASVSRVSLTSRTAEAELGHCAIFENGINTFESPMGAPFGTTVTVEDLFAKVPARKKFLKKPSVEGAKISELIQKIILANHSISIKFISNGETVFHSSGKGVEDAIYTVYGDIIKNLDYIDSTMPDITLRGYVNKPSFSKHNKTFQTLIVNGRVVENDDISYYVYICFQDYLMRRQYPMFILYIDLPFDMIDVNVHPNKMNVKFSDLNRIKGIVMNAVKSSIKNVLNIPVSVELNPSVSAAAEGVFDDTDKKSDAVVRSDAATDNAAGFNRGSCDALKYTPVKGVQGGGGYDERGANLPVNENAGKRVTSESLGAAAKSQKSQPDGGKIHSGVLREPPLTGAGVRARGLEMPFVNFAGILPSDNGQSVQEVFAAKTDCIICGKLFNTYIIVQALDNVYLIDQHAAHERLLYDKLIEAVDCNGLDVQNLLIPFIFEVSAGEKHLLDEKLGELNALGFDIAEFGVNVYALRSVPVQCMDINLKEFTGLLVEALKNGRTKKSDFIKEAIMQSACKAAVKAHDDLNKTEISALIENMLNSDGALFCPHGRPVIVKLTKTEIEKWFKRIV